MGKNDVASCRGKTCCHDLWIKRFSIVDLDLDHDMRLVSIAAWYLNVATRPENPFLEKVAERNLSPRQRKATNRQYRAVLNIMRDDLRQKDGRRSKHSRRSDDQR